MKRDNIRKLNYLNIGCGNRFHADWLNIDIVPHHKSVVQCNILEGLPYPDNHFDVIYHSHVLEHFSRKDGQAFIKECFRILKPGGIIRIAIPDLEKIARTYLQKLEGASAGNINDAVDYHWIMLELYDQTIRNQSGGEMKSYLEQSTILNEKFVYDQVGAEARILRNQLLTKNKPGIRSLVKSMLKKIRNSFMIIPFFKYYSIGKFRYSGEIHYWMYDRYSLSKLLTETGFGNVKVQLADVSFIKEWTSFKLDAEDGITHKPDSLFIEAVKTVQ